jgi:hypothetical protein
MSTPHTTHTTFGGGTYETTAQRIALWESGDRTAYPDAEIAEIAIASHRGLPIPKRPKRITWQDITEPRREYSVHVFAIAPIPTDTRPVWRMTYTPIRNAARRNARMSVNMARIENQSNKFRNDPEWSGPPQCPEGSPYNARIQL